MYIFMQIHIFDNIIKKSSLGRKSFYLPILWKAQYFEYIMYFSYYMYSVQLYFQIYINAYNILNEI